MDINMDQSSASSPPSGAPPDPIDFPPFPTVGEELTAFGVTWIWDGEKWKPSIDMGPGFPGPGGQNFLPLKGGTLTGDTADTILALNRSFAASGENQLIGQTYNTNRWIIKLGSGAETGANAGSDFYLDSYDDAGNFLFNSIIVFRDTNNITLNGFTLFNAIPSIPGGAPGLILSTDGAGTLSWIPDDTGIVDVPIDGNLYARKDQAWEQIQSPSNYLPLIGGTMTGPIVLATDPVNPLEASTKQYVDDSIAAAPYLPLAGGTLTGQATFTNSAAPILLVAPNVAAGVCVAGLIGGNLRWLVNWADGTAETGSNSGSNFNVISYSDAGAVLNIPLAIERATGIVTFSTIPSIPGGVQNQYLMTDGAGNLSWQPIGAGGSIGNLGRLLSSRQTNYITVPNNSTNTITSINLPVGDWDVDAEVGFNLDASGASMLSCGISKNPAALGMPTAPLIDESVTAIYTNFTGGVRHTLPIRTVHISLVGPGTYYLLASISGSAAPAGCVGGIYARQLTP